MASRGAVIGVDIGGTSTRGAVVSAEGRILRRAEIRTDPTAGTKGILAILDDLLKDGHENVGAIGVGAAGFVNFATGSITFAPNLQYGDAQVGAAVRAHTNLPVVVDNDANAAAWGERAFGAAVGNDDIVLVTVGTGIGSGIIIAGRLIRGHTGTGAEIGHTVIDPNGPPCHCGLRGCLEQFAAGQAIERMARDAIRDDPGSSIIDFAGSIESITAAHVAKAARQRDKTALNVLKGAGTYLGIGLSNIANVFDPQVIVLGGGVISAGEPFLGPARDELFAMTTAQRRRPMRMAVGVLGDDAGILGAAALAFEEAS